MNTFLAELSAAAIPALIALFGTLLTIVVNRASTLARERWGVEIEARHREALHSAVMSGLLAALARGLPQGAVIEAAIDHVESSVPDALGKLAPAPGVLRAIVESKLQSVIANAVGGQS